MSVPVWDQAGPQELLVIANLWTASSVVIAIVVAIAIEYVFGLFNTSDELTEGLTQRLDAVHPLLVQAAHSADRRAARDRVMIFATVGVSRLRGLALSNTPSADTGRLNTTVSLVGRLIDIIAPFRGFHNFTPQQNERLKVLADQVAALRYKLRHPSSTSANPLTPASDAPVLLLSIEQTLGLLCMSLSSDTGIDPSGNVGVLDPSLPADPPLFKQDAFTNPEHLHFALRGCMASGVCYLHH